MTVGGPNPVPDGSLLSDLGELQMFTAQSAYAEIDGEGTPRVLTISQGWSSTLDPGDLRPGVNIAAIAGLGAARLALLGDQVHAMNSLQQAASSDKFPHGTWPEASA